MMRVIPRRNIAHYQGELKDILGLILRGKLSDGPYIKEFEEQFAAYVGAPYAVAVGSGSLGLLLILDALSLEKNSEVILPAYTDESVPQVIRSLGFEPVFVDIDKNTHNIDPSLIEKKISKKTKVIIATHIFGRPCDLPKIMEIAKKHRVTVIEDCAHAVGAEYDGRRVGSFGAAAYFSFGITKPFNTFGGGMITTQDPVLHDRIKEKLASFGYPAPATLLKKALVSYGLSLIASPWFFSVIVFPWLLCLSFFDKDLIRIYNKTVKPAARSGAAKVKYTNVQALMGIKQLSRIDVENESRRRNAVLLMGSFNGSIEILKDSEAIRPTYYFFVVLTRDAADLAKKLLRKGIDTGKHIMRDCSAVDGKDSSCPVAREAIRISLQIPNYPRLTEGDMRYIAGVFNRELRHRGI